MKERNLVIVESPGKIDKIKKGTWKCTALDKEMEERI